MDNQDYFSQNVLLEILNQSVIFTNENVPKYTRNTYMISFVFNLIFYLSLPSNEASFTCGWMCRFLLPR